MGKLYRHLWHEITSFTNLLLAFRKAARGKRSRTGAASFEFKLEENLVTLRWELLDGTSVIGWINHVRYGDTWGLRRAILDQVVL